MVPRIVSEWNDHGERARIFAWEILGKKRKRGRLRTLLRSWRACCAHCKSRSISFLDFPRRASALVFTCFPCTVEVSCESSVLFSLRVVEIIGAYFGSDGRAHKGRHMKSLRQCISEGSIIRSNFPDNVSKDTLVFRMILSLSCFPRIKA